MSADDPSQPYRPPADLGPVDPAPADLAPADLAPADLDGAESTSAENSKRPLDLLSATTLVAASMIGAGVFTTSGFTLGDLGSPSWVMAAWAVAGVIAICGAICYGALATQFTESGGEYLFLSRVLHPVAGMMAGWVSLLAGFTGATAFAAMAFGEYLTPLIYAADSAPSYFSTVVPIGVIVVASLLHSVGVKPGARVQDVVVILKFLLIAAFVVVAIYAMTRPARVPQIAIPPAVPPSTTWIGLRFATALMWISLSFSGFNAAVYVAGEVKNPKINVRRAILGGTLVVTVAYLVLNAIFVFAPPAGMIVFQEQVATLAAWSIGGEGFSTFVRIVILICLFTSVSAQIMAGPRVYSKMADDGFLPAWLRFRDHAPTNAIWLQAGLAIIVVAVSNIQDLLGYLGFTLSVSAALTASLLFFIKRDTNSIPFYPLPPLVFVGATLLTATLSAYRDPSQAVVGLGTILFGAIVFPLYAKRHARTS